MIYLIMIFFQYCVAPDDCMDQNDDGDHRDEELGIADPEAEVRGDLLPHGTNVNNRSIEAPFLSYPKV